MKRIRQESAKAGGTPAARRVLEGVSAPTSAPSGNSAGYLLNETQWVHLLFTVGGTSPVFTVQVWLYSSVSSAWHQGELVSVNADDIVSLEHVGFDRIALQVTSVSGTDPTLNGWIALARETP